MTTTIIDTIRHKQIFGSLPAVARTYVVTFRSHNDDRPSKFIVVATDRERAKGLGAWRGGLSVTVRQIHLKSHRPPLYVT